MFWVKPACLGTLCVRGRLVRRAVHALQMCACAFPRRPRLPLASACLSYLRPNPCTPRRSCRSTPDFQRWPWSRSSLSVDSMPEEILTRAMVAAIVLVGTAGRPLVRELCFFAPGMKCAKTFGSMSTSPCTMPRAAARLLFGHSLRWHRTGVIDPLLTWYV